MKKRILCFIVCLALAAGCCGVYANAAGKKFSDVTDDTKWYYDYVYAASDAGLMNGTGDTTFAPNTKLSRAMFVQILANLEGIDTSDRNVKTRFSDVPAGKWYTPAVQWASERGIVNGTSADKFSPNANVQRQQICAMLLRYAYSIGITLKKDLEMQTFEDDGQISGYAKTAVYACQQAGIVSGVSATAFNPKGEATHAQIAKIISVFYDLYSYANRAHQYLYRWVKANGEASGDYIDKYYYDNENGIEYGIHINPMGYVYINETFDIDGKLFAYAVYLNDKRHEYSSNCSWGDSCKASSTVYAEKFTPGSSLTDVNYTGSIDRDAFLEEMRICRNETIAFLDLLLTNEVGGITLEDFGFTNYK